MQNVKIEQQFMLSIISNVLFKTSFDIANFNNLDYEYIKKKVEEQKFDVMFYNGLLNNNIKNEYTSFLEKRMFQLLLLTTNQENEYKKITKLFENNNIDYVPLKGTFMKHYYPSSDYRLMGDVDILIHEDKRKDVNNLLINNGYTFEEDAHSSHHDIYDRGKYGHFEIHFRLLDELNQKRDFIDENVWNYTNDHKFEIEFNIVYLCAHYANHFKNGGASFKSMLDIALLLYKDNIDFDKLKTLLIDSDLYEFYNNIVSIINYAFNQQFYQFENNLNDDEICQLINYLFVCGDFGFGEENNSDHIRLVNEMSKKKKINFFGKLGYILSQVCIPYRQFKHISKTIKYVPILLPFGWIIRLLKFMIFKKDRMKSRLSSIKNIKNEDIDNYQIVSKMLGKSK